MALNSMDDKLLGEKVQYYYSSSEDEEEVNSDTENTDKASNTIKGPSCDPFEKWDGKAVHTGPKGVIEDWRRYKQLEIEKREKDELEKKNLCKKLSMTCSSFRDDQEAKKEDSDPSDDEDFMEWYKQKRIFEMQQKFAKKWASVVFGRVYELDQNNFVETIEQEKKVVTIVIHIYDEGLPACQAINGCMQVLASKYKNMKFCRIKATEAQVSTNFLENALPTLIVYKDKMVIGNFVRLGDTLGDDFYAPDLEAFLQEYGILQSIQ